MIILGIDPGYAIVGIGVLEYKGNKFRPIECTTIETHASMITSLRLKKIKEELCTFLHNSVRFFCSFSLSAVKFLPAECSQKPPFPYLFSKKRCSFFPAPKQSIQMYHIRHPFIAKYCIFCRFRRHSRSFR